MRRKPGELTPLEGQILLAIHEHPEHCKGRPVWGYLLAPEGARTGGVYRALDRLEDMGYVIKHWRERRKCYGLTAEGRARFGEE